MTTSRVRCAVSWLSLAVLVDCAPPARPLGPLPVAASAGETAPAPAMNRPETSTERVLDLTDGTIPLFSADGAHFYGDVGRDERRVFIVDGREVARSRYHISPVVVAPDASWVTYPLTEVLPEAEQKRTGRGSRNVLVHHGVATEVGGQIATLAVSPDGAHVAYGFSIANGEDGAVVVDGKRVARAKNAQSLAMTSDGKRWAFAETVSHRTGGATVTVDGRKSGRYDGADGLVFSSLASGSHFAYLAQRGPRESLVVVDEKEGSRYASASAPRFTADGRVVYGAVRLDGRFVVVVGPREHGPYRSVEPLVIAGDTVAWVAGTTDANQDVAHLVIDGREVWHANLGPSSPLADREPPVAGLVADAASRRVAFAHHGSTLLVEGAGTVVPLGPGIPVAFASAGSRLVVERNRPAGIALAVLTCPEGLEVRMKAVDVSEIYATTVRIEGRLLRYYARSERSLVRVGQTWD